MTSTENCTQSAHTEAQKKSPKCEWFDGRSVDELRFCEEFLAENNLRFIEECYYNINGIVPAPYIEKLITDKLITAGVRFGFANKIKNLMNALRHICYQEDLPSGDDEIHLLNGVLKTDGTFIPDLQFCRNRINISYAVNTPHPTNWLSFVNDLLEPTDILTLQEYLGYCLINSTKAQSMLFLVGKGGEGKSRIGVVIEKLFGTACYFESIVALSKDKFLRGNLVGKTVLVDDDMSFEGIKDTSFLKNLVTAETSISVQWKNRQAIQAKLRTRAIVFSNSSPTSLYDKTDGWHRRLIVLSTKSAPPERIPDRFLSEKLLAELDGIFLWAFEGLMRLIKNNFMFTLSEKTVDSMTVIRNESCNISEFMQDEQAVQFRSDITTCSVDIYNAYCNWCYGNGLEPLRQKRFYDWFAQNCQQYNLVPTNKAYNGRSFVRGYEGIRVSFRSHIE